jgi:hypothetical protein
MSVSLILVRLSLATERERVVNATVDDFIVAHERLGGS